MVKALWSKEGQGLKFYNSVILLSLWTVCLIYLPTYLPYPQQS